MSEPEEIPEGFQKERWVFIGQGVTDKNKQVARFRDGKGTGWTIGWDRSTHGHLAVGYVYEAGIAVVEVVADAEHGGEVLLALVVHGDGNLEPDLQDLSVASWMHEDGSYFSAEEIAEVIVTLYRAHPRINA